MKRHYTVQRADGPCEVALETIGPDRFRFVIGEDTIELTARQLGPGQYLLLHDGRVHDLTVVGTPPALHVVGREGQLDVEVLDEHRLARLERVSGALGHAGGAVVIAAPMPGKVVQILAEVGGEVGEGQPVLVVEAMKMENELRSPAAGQIKQVLVEPGQSVEAGQQLVLIE